MEPTLKTNAYERGTYYFFDCLNWRKVAKVTFCCLLDNIPAQSLEGKADAIEASLASTTSCVSVTPRIAQNLNIAVKIWC